METDPTLDLLAESKQPTCILCDLGVMSGVAPVGDQHKPFLFQPAEEAAEERKWYELGYGTDLSSHPGTATW